MPFTLVLQWAPGVCSGNSGVACQINPVPIEFTIHGLWPEPNGAPSNDDFDGQKFFSYDWQNLVVILITVFSRIFVRDRPDQVLRSLFLPYRVPHGGRGMAKRGLLVSAHEAAAELAGILGEGAAAEAETAAATAEAATAAAAETAAAAAIK
uniref:Uncharacterized protein n=1 Tax=Tanacetum cinerariifolium TaxID=118510 RepID=A0A6L2LLC8_TANCI|nr:hypothetical protein [Tanacetum cinerariifolium]